MALLELIPEDARQRIQELSETDLLVYFKSFDWNKCLKAYLLNLSETSLRDLLRRLYNATPQENRDALAVPSNDMEKETLIDELAISYKLSTATESTVNSIIGDMQRAWAAREEDQAGRAQVAHALDIVFVKEHPHRLSLPICAAVHKIGFECSEVLTRSGEATPFFRKNMKGLQAFKLLIEFWEKNVPANKMEGFIGRFLTWRG